jgi:type II secretion system protein L
MSFPGCLVIERTADWLIVVGNETDTIGVSASAEELATCVSLLVKQRGIKNPQCVLAPASASCFFATLEPSSDIDLRDHAAMTYELEDHLPLDAESMVADFSVVPSTADQKTVSCVAIEIHRWRAISDALEAADISVRSIVPAAILAARSLCLDFNLTDNLQLVIVAGNDCDLIKLNAETILSWKYSQLDLNLLRRHQLLESTTHACDHVLAVGTTQQQQAIIRQAFPEAQFAQTPTLEHLTAGAELTLLKPAEHWFDLRRGELGPADPLRPIQSHLRLAAIAATVFLLAMLGGGWWRTQRIESEIDRIKDLQAELFQTAFPGTTVRGDVAFRVRREHQSLMGLRGAATKDIDLPQSAPSILRELLSALPENMRFRFTSIKVLDGHFVLDVELRDFVDAGEISDALSKAGFIVDPPQVTKKEAGSESVGAVLEGDWVGRATDDLSQERLTTAEAAG